MKSETQRFTSVLVFQRLMPLVELQLWKWFKRPWRL